jgi:predicted GNAT family acetyltransferase
MADPTPKTEQALDETIEESFPASDPPANTPETGIRTGEVPVPDSNVVDHQAQKRFELTIDDHTAYLAYERTHDTLTLVHTEVPEELRGRRVGDTLVKAALEAGRAAGLRIVAVCPFVRAYLRKHPAT